MKTLTLSKVALTMVVTAQLLSAEAFADLRRKEVNLTSDKVALEDPYFQIKSVTVQEISDEEAAEIETESLMRMKDLRLPPKAGVLLPDPAPSSGASSVIMIIDKLIAIGQKLIPTIKEGQAVVNNNPMTAISVLPRVEGQDPTTLSMGNWSLPTGKNFKIVYTNGFGSEVVTFVYSVTFQHSGTFDGKGKYLAGIRAAAKSIEVSWGFNLNASSQLIQISNIGTLANPIAAATLEMAYTVSNWTKTTTDYETYFVAGDGRLYKMN